MQALLMMIDDWLSSPTIADMDAAEERGYFRLCFHAAKLEYEGLPNDERLLASWSLLGRQWGLVTRDRRFRSQLTSGQKIMKPFFERDGRLFNAKVLTFVDAYHSRRKRAVEAATKRWSREADLQLNDEQLLKHQASNASRIENGSESGLLLPNTKKMDLSRTQCPGSNSDIERMLDQAFDDLVQQYPAAGRERLEQAHRIFFAKVEAEVSNSGRQYDEIIREIHEGLSRWKKSDRWHRNKVHLLKNWLAEAMWAEHPLSSTETQRASDLDCRRRLEAKMALLQEQLAAEDTPIEEGK